ncbi:MAG TPA: nucleotidyltransferase domain-containing protein, partial [Rhodopila sp.]
MAVTTRIDDPVLIRFCKALGEIYGNQIDCVVLFGSRARGDARPDSDYDVAVFLKSLPDLLEVLARSGGQGGGVGSFGYPPRQHERRNRRLLRRHTLCSRPIWRAFAVFARNSQRWTCVLTPEAAR